MNSQGLALREQYVREGAYGFASGSEAVAALLDEREPPTAIFASNDIMAAAVVKVAAERGVAVPRDLSVVGFDDSAIAEMVSPALTTIRRPLLDMAREATQRLTRLIAASSTEPAEVRYDLSVFTRASTGPAPDGQ